MKRALLALAIASTMLLTACGADEKTIDGVTYGTYGIVNKERDAQSEHPVRNLGLVDLLVCDLLRDDRRSRVLHRLGSYLLPVIP